MHIFCKAADSCAAFAVIHFVMTLLCQIWAAASNQSVPDDLLLFFPPQRSRKQATSSKTVAK